MVTYLINRSRVDLEFQRDVAPKDSSFQCFDVAPNISLTLEKMSIIVLLSRFNMFIRQYNSLSVRLHLNLARSNEN